MPNSPYQAMSGSRSIAHFPTVPARVLELVKLSPTTFTASPPLDRSYPVAASFNLLHSSNAFAYFVFHPYGTANGFTGVIESITFRGELLERPLLRSALSLNHEGGVTEVTGEAARVHGRFFSPHPDANRVVLYYGTADGGTEPDRWEQSLDLGLFAPRPTAVPLAAEVSGLRSETAYYYRFQISAETAVAWSPNAGSFVTPFLAGRAPLLLSAKSFGPFRADLEWHADFRAHTGFVIERATMPEPDRWEFLALVGKDPPRWRVPASPRTA